MAKFKKKYPSITARDKEYNRIWPIGGAPRVTIKSWSEVEKTGRQKQSYIEIEGDKEWVDAYKKIAFSGKGNKNDVIDYVNKMEENKTIKLKDLITEKTIKYKAKDWKKYHSLHKRGKLVAVQTAFGDEFSWDEADNDGVWGLDQDGREVELTHDEIAYVMVF